MATKKIAEHDNVPHIDALWGALERDDELITDAETDLIDTRLAMVRERTTECLEWPLVRDYILSRPNPTIASN